MKESFEIRDLRNKQFFMVDDEYLNGYARLCGINATGVYSSLCRHSNKNQTCFPSVKLISEELAISERSVIRAVKTLEKYNIISKSRERKDNAKWLNNLYVLLDKSVWKNKPSDSQSYGNQVTENTKPSDYNDKSHMPHSHTKETHSKGTHEKDIADHRSALPFSFKEYLKELENHKARHVNVIGHYFEEKGIEFDSRIKANVAVKRHLRASVEVAKFSDEEIVNATNKAKKEYKGMWTVETILKILTR